MNSHKFLSLQEAYLDVYEEFVDPEEGKAPSGRSPLENVSYHPKASVRRKAVRAMRKQMEKEYGGKWKTRSDDPVKEEADLYDIILSHLLDEGYANNIESAEVIMVNMSEEWRESICEGYKKLPIGKMIGKTLGRGERLASTKDFYADNDVLSGSGIVKKRENELERSRKMINVADDHNPTKAKGKEDDNRRIGGRKRDVGRLRRNELQDNW
jgi:hypothetical protein